jgi:hypothetical protein
MNQGNQIFSVNDANERKKRDNQEVSTNDWS